MPSAMSDRFRQLTGADVSNVRVHRDDQSAQAAARIGAVSFAAGEHVVLPPSAGSLADSRAQGLLAHELTHVIQQRRLRGSVPDERSAAGQALEQEAQAVERHVRDEPQTPVPEMPATSPAAPDSAFTPSVEDLEAIRRVEDEFLSGGFATRDSSGALVFGPPSPAATDPHVTEAPTESIGPESAVRALGMHHQAPAATGDHATAADSLLLPDGDSAPRLARVGDQYAPIQRAEAPAPPDPVHTTMPTFQVGPEPWAPAPSLSTVELAPQAASVPVSGTPAPGTPAEDPESLTPPDEPFQQPEDLDLDELARRLYDRVQRQLKLDLTIERERFGLIADLR